MLTMPNNSENNGTGEIGLVTPTPGPQEWDAEAYLVNNMTLDREITVTIQFMVES